MIEFRDKVIVYFLLYIAHGKLLLGILAYLGYPGTTSFDIVLTDALYGSVCQLIEAIVVEY